MTNPSDPWAQRSDSPDTPTERIGASGEPEGMHTTEHSDAYGAGNNPTEPYEYFEQHPGPNPTRELPPYQSQWGVYDTPGTYESGAYETQWGGPDHPPGGPGGPVPPTLAGPPPGLVVGPPRRSRRGVWLILTLVLFAVVVLGGMAAGLYLAGNDSTSSSAAGSATQSAPMQIPGFPQTPGSTMPTMPQMPGMGSIDSLGATMGTISTNDGSTLTIDSLSGSTVTVHTDAKTQVIALGAGTIADLHPGDMVVVQGDKNPDGSIRARIIIGTALPSSGTAVPTPTR